MKQYSLFLALTALMVFSFGLAHGQSEVVLDAVEGLLGSATSDTVEIDTPLKFTFRLTQNTGDSIFAFSHGFQVYTKLSDANPTTSGYFDAPVLDTLPIGPSGWCYHSVYNPNGHFDDIPFNHFSLDGLGRDTTAVSAVWVSGNAPGFEDGYSEQVWYIATEAHTEGDTLCIDSSFFPPGGAWLWSLSAGTPPTLSPDWYGPYCYRVQGPSAVTEINGPELPKVYSLSQNYPNPFNPTTEINFDVPTKSHVTLTVYNVLGQKVSALVDKEMAPGRYVADWNGTTDGGTEVSSGIYFYKLEASDFAQTKKMILLK